MATGPGEALAPPDGQSGRGQTGQTAALLFSLPPISCSFLEQLAEFDWEAVAKEEGIPRALGLLNALGNLLPGSGEGAGKKKDDEDQQAPTGGSAEGGGGVEAAALRGAAQGAGRAARAQGNSVSPDGLTERAELPSRSSQTGVYKPFVPGRIVLVARNGEGQPRRVLLPDPSDPVLRSFRLTATTVSDHFIDSEAMEEALGETTPRDAAGGQQEGQGAEPERSEHEPPGREQAAEESDMRGGEDGSLKSGRGSGGGSAGSETGQAEEQHATAGGGEETAQV